MPVYRHTDPEGYRWLQTFSELQIFHLILKLKFVFKNLSFFNNQMLKKPTSAYYIPIHIFSCYFKRGSKISC